MIGELQHVWPTWEKARAEIGRGCQEDNATNDKLIERGNWEMEKIEGQGRGRDTSAVSDSGL